MKTDPDFRFVPFDKTIGLSSTIPPDATEEIYAQLEDDYSTLIGTARLYKNALVLEVHDARLHYGSRELIIRLPNLRVLKILWEQDSPHTKRLVNWYIGYEASSFEEAKTYFMAKILGDNNGLVGL